MRILYILLVAFRLSIVSAKYLPDESGLTDLVRNARSIRDVSNSIVETQSNDYHDNTKRIAHTIAKNQAKLQEDMEEKQNNLQKKFEKEIQKLQENFDEDVQTLQENFEKEHNKLQKMHEKEINKQQEKFESKIKKLQEKLEEEQKKLQEKFEEEIKGLQKKLEEELNKLQEQFEEEQKKLQEQLEEEQEELQDNFEEEQQENFEEKQKQLQGNFEEEQKKLQIKFEKERNNLQETFEKKHKKLQEKFEKEHKKLQDKFEKEKKKLQEKIEEEQKILQEKAEEEQKKLQENVEEERKKLQKKFEEEKYELQENFEEDKHEIQENFEEDLKKLQEKFEEEQNKLQQKFEEEQKKLQDKLTEEQQKRERKIYLLRHVNAAYIKKLQTELETKLNELNNNTALLQNVSYPWAAQKAIEEKKSVLTNVVQYLTSVMSNWITAEKPTPNARAVFNSAPISVVDGSNVNSNNTAIIPANSTTTTSIGVPVSNFTSALVSSAQEGRSVPTNGQGVQGAVISNNAQDTSAASISVPISVEALSGSPAASNDANHALTSSATFRNSQVKGILNSASTESSSSINNNTLISTETSVSSASTSNIGGISADPSSSSLSSNKDISSAGSSNDILITGLTSNIVLNGTETTNTLDSNTIANIGVEAKGQISNKTTNVGVKSSLSETSEIVSINFGSSTIGPGVLITSTSADENVRSLTVSSLNTATVGTADSVFLGSNDINNAYVKHVFQVSDLLTSSGAETTTDLVSLRSNNINNADVDSVSQASVTLTLSGVGVSTNSVTPGLYPVNTADVNSVTEVSVTSAGAGITTDSVAISTNDVNNADASSVSPVFVALTSFGAGATEDSASQSPNDINNADANPVSQASVILTSAQAKQTVNSMPLSSNEFNNAGVNTAFQASIPSKSSGNGATEHSVSQSSNNVSNAGVNSYSHESVLSTLVGSGSSVDVVSLNSEGMINASVNTATISTDGNYMIAASLDTTTTAPDSKVMNSLNTISNRVKASEAGLPDVTSTNTIETISSNNGIDMNAVNAATSDPASIVYKSVVTALNNISSAAKASVAGSLDVTSNNILGTSNFSPSIDIAPTTLTLNSTVTGFITAIDDKVSTNSDNNIVSVNTDSDINITNRSAVVDAEAIIGNFAFNSKSKTSVPFINNNPKTPITTVIPNDVVISFTETSSVKSAVVDVIPTSNEGLISTTIPAYTNVEVVSTISSDAVTVAQTNAANTEGIVVSATEAALNETASTIAENNSIPSINADLNVTSVNMLVTETIPQATVAANIAPVETVVEDNITTISFDVLTITNYNVPTLEVTKTTTAASIAKEAASTDVVLAEIIVDNPIGASYSDVSRNTNSNDSYTDIIVDTPTETVPSKMTGTVGTLAAKEVEITISDDTNVKRIVVAETRAAASKSTNITRTPSVETSTISSAIASETKTDIVNIPTESNFISITGAISYINVANNEAAVVTTEVVPRGLNVITASSTEPSIAVETGARNILNVVEVISNTDLPVAIVAEANTHVDALAPLSTTSAENYIASISNILSSGLATTDGSFTEEITNATSFASMGAINSTVNTSSVAPSELAHTGVQTAATVKVITNVEPSKITFPENAATITEVGVPSASSDVWVVESTHASFTKNKPSPTHVPEISASVTGSAVLSTPSGLNEVFADAVNTEIFATTETSQTIQDIIFTPTIPVEVGASLLEVTQQ